jgi:nicotinate-nucleotide--dimethylbenzimidazole phosphoribosyltransferase
MRLGEGTGAALGISLVEASVKTLNEMATFSEAGVSDIQ